MALDEGTMRSQVTGLLRKFHAVAVEDACAKGIPDVNCTLGWLELKSVDLPKKPDTPVRVPHFTQDQKIFLRLRENAGGLAVLLLKASSWWLVFDAETAYEIVGKVPLSILVERCIGGWGRKPRKEELALCLIQHLDSLRGTAPGGLGT